MINIVTRDWTPERLRMTLVNNIDSNQLILVEKSARQIGKTSALIEVAKTFGIPLIVGTNAHADLVNLRAEKKIAYGSRNMDVLRSILKPEVGFMTDDEVPLKDILNIHEETAVKVRVGFHENVLFVD